MASHLRTLSGRLITAGAAARVLDYDDYNQPGLYGPDAYRSSGQGPVMVGLRLGEKTRYWVYLPLVAREYASR